MKCPVCSTVDLLIAERSGVEIDYCPKCRGVWLDRGELDKLIERAEMAAAERDLPFIEPPPRAKRGAEAPDLLDLERDFAERRRFADPRRHYDHDDDWAERFRYEDVRSHGKRKSFLSELFDIFD
ncbi:MAG: zf-TFIIB domain-containing protein [Chloroflexi bacterium]|jgi:Zn-finger nucleic acid-binding protein|nr:zf-TFIIB domain-containing protein [Chloroflexota bacterium]